MENLVNLISELGCAGKAAFTTSKELKTKKNCPFKSLAKKTSYEGAMIGYDYITEIHKAQDASGSDKEYTTGTSWHKTYNRFFNVSKKDESKFYLKIILSGAGFENATAKTTWLADGKEIAYDEIEEWLYSGDKIKESGSIKKQEDAGISEENQVRFILVSVDNIIEFHQADINWSK